MRYLIDKSALARMIHPEVQTRLGPRIECGDAATCSVIDLEVLYSAKNAREYADIRRRRKLAYDQLLIHQETFDRALEVQAELAKKGHHRVPIPDLLIAAVAEQANAVVVHYDTDFETIAKVTGQPVEWVVPRGSID